MTKKKKIAIAAGVALLTLTSVFILLRVTNSNTTSQQSEEVKEITPLSVEVTKPQRSVVNTFTEVTIKANKEIQLVKPETKVELVAVGELNGDKYYVARVKDLTNGETIVNLQLKDADEQMFESKLIITKSSFTMPAGYKEIPAWPNAEYILDPDNYNGPINKQYRLLEDYEPTDIVDLNKAQQIFTFNNASLRSDAAAALRRMLDELKKVTGQSVTVASGYRTFNEQMAAHSGILIRQGETAGLKISARPGHSEHQLGTTIDITHESVQYDLVQAFENTVPGKWLIENSQNFGFIRSLDEQQADYIYEPWHFRYVGDNN